MITRPQTHDLASGLHDIVACFEDDHVHMALVVAPDGRLISTIERVELPPSGPASLRACELGTLTGRTIDPAAGLDATTALLVRQRRRRLAVVDDSGRLLGLLCLKKDCTGYCSDDGIGDRAAQRYGAGIGHQ